MNKPFFSIVIPYYAQSETIDLLKRQLNYYHNHEVSCFVIIAVSGQKNAIQNLQKFIEDIHNPYFKIVNHDDENIKNIDTFISKTYEAIQTVTTPYAVINGADDVLILDTVAKCCNELASNPEISGIKGHTVYYNANNGKIFCSNDINIIGHKASDRIKYVIQDRDSIFYIVQKSATLLEEFRIISTIYQSAQDLFAENLFLIEHIRALNVASLGNVKVLDSPWRVQTTHDNNHSAHTPAAFVRIKKGLLDRDSYKLFQELNISMKNMSNAKYQLLSIFSQIKSAHTTSRQILYELFHRRISLKSFLKISIYFLLNKLFKFFFSKKPMNYYYFNNDFITTKIYGSLKKQYFSATDISLIESFTKNE